MDTEKIKRGQILKELRKSKDLSQSVISKMLDITLQAYQKYEYGTAEPTFDKLCKLADFYGVTTDYLLGRDIPERAKKMTIEEMEQDILNRWLELGTIGRELVLNALRSIINLADAKESEKAEEQKQITHQTPDPPIIQSQPPIQQQPVQPPVIQSSPQRQIQQPLQQPNLQRQIPPQKSDIQILNSEVAAARSRNGEYKPLPTDEQMESFEEVKPGMI